MFTGGYMTQGCSSYLFKESVISLCARLKPEAVSLADAIAPPDFILNSVLGYSDGEVKTYLFIYSLLVIISFINRIVIADV